MIKSIFGYLTFYASQAFFCKRACIKRRKNIKKHFCKNFRFFLHFVLHGIFFNLLYTHYCTLCEFKLISWSFQNCAICFKNINIGDYYNLYFKKWSEINEILNYT